MADAMDVEKRPEEEQDNDDNDNEEEEEEEDSEEKRRDEEYSAWAEDSARILYSFVHSSRFSDDTKFQDVVWLPQGTFSDTTQQPHYSPGITANTHDLVISTNNENGGPEMIYLASTVVPTAFSAGLHEDPRKEGSTGPYKTIVHSTICHPTPARRVVFNKTRPNILAANTTNGEVVLYDTKEKGFERVATLVGHKQGVEGFGLEFSPFKPNLLASAMYDNNVLLWDITQVKQEMEPAHAFPGLHSDLITMLSFSHADANIVATSSDDKSIKLSDLRSRNTISSYTDKKEQMFNCAFNPSGEGVHGNALIVANSAGEVCVFDIRNMTESYYDIKTGGSVTCLKWMTGGFAEEDRSRIVVGLDDGRVELYDLNHIHNYSEFRTGGDGDMCLLGTHFGHKSQCEAVACPTSLSENADGCVTSIEADGIVQVWRLNEQSLDIDHGMFDGAGLLPTSKLAR